MGGYQKFRNICASLLAVLLLVPGSAAAYDGTVVDALTCKPIPGAFVTLGDTVVRTSQDGHFQIGGEGAVLGLRAYGYGRSEIPVGDLKTGETLSLAPFRPKALYLSSYGAGNMHLRESALDLIGKTDLNAVVIDVKSDRGMIAYRTDIPLAAEIGAQKGITIKHIRRLIDDLHKKGIYAIARIVVFKDNLLALARPDWAVRTASGAIWRDREGIGWTDPFARQVWDYNIDIAVEAARDGFDEIQFDYVRFPDAKGLVFSEPNTEKNRIAAISGFLAAARKRLVPYNVFLSADIFGYVIWNRNDTGIGQRLNDLAQQVDYISPMLYPSGFQYGIPGYPDPVRHPRQIVYLSLRKAEERTGLPAVRFRPWLQAFRDYAFGGQPFGSEEIAAQIDAAQSIGADGWMLWNPRNVYTAAGLPPKPGMEMNSHGGAPGNLGRIGTGTCSRNIAEDAPRLGR
ncbi:putative glycoside hydrolase [Acidithiobacillus sulfuriphilus]|uniref:GTP-binding protein n=1 Tax=Acidithiobacillus sulfuriphilus TaxID=1867749 RepID=A0A3M8QNC5_9PROT|nr:GTP-binding protein [Acidithiobacillus sulfuriphilus]